MVRRPLAAAAASFGAGTVVQHLASGSFETAVLALTAALLVSLLFIFVLNCNKITKKGINGIITSEMEAVAPAEQGEAGADCGGAETVRSTVVQLALIVVIFVAMGALEGYLYEHRISQFNDVCGDEITAYGCIKSVSISAGNKCSFVLDVNSFSYSSGSVYLKKSEKILVYVSEIDGRRAAALTGNIVSVSGTVSRPDGASNPGTFDYSLYLLSKDIRMTMRADASAVDLSGNSPRELWYVLNMIAVFKYDYEQRILSQIDDRCAQMLLGILFGDDSFMDEELKTSFQQNGLAHLLAASGLHVGFVYGLFNVLMRKPSTVRGNIPVMIVLVIYAALAGFSASVVRAVFMIIVHIIGRVTHRRYDFLTSIAFCALVLLVWRPANIFSSGFQLSFAAVITLSIVLKRTEQLMNGLYKSLGDNKGYAVRIFAAPAAGMAALQLGMLPLTVKNFHYVSIAGFFLNVPAIALAGLIVPIGIILIPLAYAGGPVFIFIGNMEEMLVKMLLILNDSLAGTALSYRYTASPPSWAFIMYYITLFFMCSEAGQACVRGIAIYGKRTVCVPLLAAAVISAGCGTAADADRILSDMVFVDVGQGDCAHLKGTHGVDVMFDSGGSEKKDIGMETLMPYFLANGVNDIDLAVISHLHTDHYGGLLTMKDAVSVKRLALSAVYESRAQEISEQTGVSAEEILFLKAGDIVSVGGGVTLHVLAPAAGSRDEYVKLLEDEEDENKLSLIVKAEYKGRSVLFTGDIDSEYERELVDAYENVQGRCELCADILKIAHHGSKYSSSDIFLDTVRPDVSVIQVGRNLYGHPTPEAISRIDEQGSLMFRNDYDGAIMIRMGRRMTVRTVK